MRALPPSIAAYYNCYSPEINDVLLVARDIILSADSQIFESIKHTAPFFIWNKRTLCYLWVAKKTQQAYIGFPEGYRMEHPLLVKGSRKRIKNLMLDEKEDLPYDVIIDLLHQSMELMGTR